MKKPSPAQRKVVGQVLHEWKSGSPKVPPVKSQKQAVGIAISEAKRGK